MLSADENGWPPVESKNGLKATTLLCGFPFSKMIYVLLLEQGKIYVGYSERTNGERFLEHFNHSGSRWTVKYKPVQVLQILEGGRNDEDEMTLKMMHKYGWWNVRGGNWCQVEMCTCPKALLEWQQVNMPTKLGQKKASAIKPIHLAKQRMVKVQKARACTRCGRTSHSREQCYAKTITTNKALVEAESESESESHSDSQQELDSQESDSSVSTAACFRCGRNSHWSKDCYARTDVDGNIL